MTPTQNSHKTFIFNEWLIILKNITLWIYEKLLSFIWNLISQQKFGKFKRLSQYLQLKVYAKGEEVKGNQLPLSHYLKDIYVK